MIIIFYIILGYLCSTIYGSRHFTSSQEVSGETLSETLLINHLDSGHITQLFQFDLELPLPGPQSPPHISRSIFPSPLSNLMLDHDLESLHLSLTQGIWDTALWGASIGSLPVDTAEYSLKPLHKRQNTSNLESEHVGSTDPPFNPSFNLSSNLHLQPNIPGASLKYSHSTHSSSSAHPSLSTIKTASSSIRGMLSSLFCASLSTMPLTRHNTTSSTPNSNSVSHSQFVSGWLPVEATCTENLSAFLRLLPCSTASSTIQSLLRATSLFAGSYTSIGLKLNRSPSPTAGDEVLTARLYIVSVSPTPQTSGLNGTPFATVSHTSSPSLLPSTIDYVWSSDIMWNSVDVSKQVELVLTDGSSSRHSRRHNRKPHHTSNPSRESFLRVNRVLTGQEVNGQEVSGHGSVSEREESLSDVVSQIWNESKESLTGKREVRATCRVARSSSVFIIHPHSNSHSNSSHGPSNASSDTSTDASTYTPLFEPYGRYQFQHKSLPLLPSYSVLHYNVSHSPSSHLSLPPLSQELLSLVALRHSHNNTSSLHSSDFKNQIDLLTKSIFLALSPSPSPSSPNSLVMMPTLLNWATSALVTDFAPLTGSSRLALMGELQANQPREKHSLSLPRANSTLPRSLPRSPLLSQTHYQVFTLHHNSLTYTVSHTHSPFSPFQPTSNVTPAPAVTMLVRVDVEVPWSVGDSFLSRLSSSSHQLQVIIHSRRLPLNEASIVEQLSDHSLSASRQAVVVVHLNSDEVSYAHQTELDPSARDNESNEDIGYSRLKKDTFFSVYAWITPSLSSSPSFPSSLVVSIPYESYLHHSAAYPPDISRGRDIPPSTTRILATRSVSLSESQTCPISTFLLDHLCFSHVHLTDSQNSITILSPPITVGVPFPDKSMPFNVIAIAMTVAAFALGSLFNLLHNSDKDFAVISRTVKIAKLVAVCQDKCTVRNNKITQDTDSYPKID